MNIEIYFKSLLCLCMSDNKVEDMGERLKAVSVMGKALEVKNCFKSQHSPKTPWWVCSYHLLHPQLVPLLVPWEVGRMSPMKSLLQQSKFWTLSIFLKTKSPTQSCLLGSCLSITSFQSLCYCPSSQDPMYWESLLIHPSRLAPMPPPLWLSLPASSPNTDHRRITCS